MRCTGSLSTATTDGDDEPRDQAAAEPVPDAVVEERPAHEGVAAADELRHLDLVAPVLDVEADRVADDHEDAEREQHRRQQHAAPHHVEDRVEAADPLGVELHDVDAGRSSCSSPVSACDAPRLAELRVRPHDQRVRQRIVLQRVERLAEARVAPELRERLVGLIERDLVDVAALAGCARPRASPGRASPTASCRRRCRARCSSRRSPRARSAPARAGRPAARARCRSRGSSAASRRAAARAARASRPASARAVRATAFMVSPPGSRRWSTEAAMARPRRRRPGRLRPGSRAARR